MIPRIVLEEKFSICVEFWRWERFRAWPTSPIFSTSAKSVSILPTYWPGHSTLFFGLPASRILLCPSLVIRQTGRKASRLKTSSVLRF